MTADERPGPEGTLAVRVLDTLLREDYGGLSGRVRLHQGKPVLDLPAARAGAGLVLPLERDGFLADFRIRAAAAADGPSLALGAPLTLDDVESVLTAVGDPLDAAGAAAFAAECRQALAALRLRERHLPEVRGRLAELWLAAPDALSGSQGLLAYEALAATMPHPVYPTSESRLGFSADDSLRYAPEYRPEFALHWVAVPLARLVTAGKHDDRPPGWPTPPEVGLPESLAATHDLMPVHPLTARGELGRALAAAGLADQAAIAPGTGLRVTPTLSTRTVAVTGHPGSHIKLPLPTSTLGRLNRRSIQPGTLADGALVHDILAAAVAADPLLGGLLLADETSYAHAGHPYLGYLLRRLPAGLERCRIVPVAGLLAPSPAAAETGRPLVVNELARWAWDGDLPGLFGAYLEVLFGVPERHQSVERAGDRVEQQDGRAMLSPRAVAGQGAAGLELPGPVRDLAARLGADGAGDGALPAYIYDLDGLAAHTAGIRAAIPHPVEFCYAVKANPDPAVLRVVARHVDGLEVSSGGELRHAAATVPGARLAFSGPGKTSAELAAAVRAGTFRFHVESPQELRLLGTAALAAGRPADVLLRANPPATDADLAASPGAVFPDLAGGLVMGRQPSPFGMDPASLEHCAQWLSAGSPEAGQLRLRGLHTHLASGLAALPLLGSAVQVLDFARGWCARHGVRNPEINLGGGMAVDYRKPGARFDWSSYGLGLARAALRGETLRIEPGRAVTAYCGWYITRVLDLKRSHGKVFAVVAGGTHHLRTPAAKTHDQPFVVMTVSSWPHAWSRPAAVAEPVTVAGQLCTPKDVLARDVRATRLRAGDLLAFGLAGAYAWNISHHGFLMHAEPGFHYAGAG